MYVNSIRLVSEIAASTSTGEHAVSISHQGLQQHHIGIFWQKYNQLRIQCPVCEWKGIMAGWDAHIQTSCQGRRTRMNFRNLSQTANMNCALSYDTHESDAASQVVPANSRGALPTSVQQLAVSPLQQASSHALAEWSPINTGGIPPQNRANNPIREHSNSLSFRTTIMTQLPRTPTSSSGSMTPSDTSVLTAADAANTPQRVSSLDHPSLPSAADAHPHFKHLCAWLRQHANYYGTR